MVNARGSDDPIEEAVALMTQALVVLDDHDGADVIGAKLQEAIDAACSYQSRAAPRA